MIHPEPPAFFQNTLFALLSSRDQESIPGDLLEAYAERRRSGGAFAANLWYAAQVTSVAPQVAAAAYRRSAGLVFLCCFTAACGAWLGTMDILLGHHDLLYHESIAGLIVGQALLTLITLPLRRLALLRWADAIGGLAIAWLGGSALLAVIRGDHSFEGYILIIALSLVIQAGLTWRAMLRRHAVAA